MAWRRYRTLGDAYRMRAGSVGQLEVETSDWTCTKAGSEDKAAKIALRGEAAVRAAERPRSMWPRCLLGSVSARPLRLLWGPSTLVELAQGHWGRPIDPARPPAS